MRQNGVSREEVEEIINSGQKSSARLGRWRYEHLFPYHGVWHGREYSHKRVVIIAAHEHEVFVITVWAMYGSW
jgi:hypothetical protein